ncbi:MAG TPA: heme-binding domain-containing protein [Candidatus Binatia bacterium]|nr:heme-binding domain-containing protein [Candidatus Binatia bacterium]
MGAARSSIRLWLRRIALALAGLLLASQLIPVDRSNPTADPSKAIYAAEKVPAPVREVFRRSCQNCHSNETSWPWYSYIAPVSWVIAHDVHEARRKMNFSEWGTYPANRREEKLEELCEQVTNGDMPDPKYLLLHRSARPTPQQRDAVCQWTEDSRQY